MKIRGKEYEPRTIGVCREVDRYSERAMYGVLEVERERTKEWLKQSIIKAIEEYGLIEFESRVDEYSNMEYIEARLEVLIPKELADKLPEFNLTVQQHHQV